MAAHQAPPSLGFSRQEHWSGLPFPSPMHESEKWKWSRSVASDSSQPHGLQATRLLRPWDFPGKSTGVGCHCLLHIYISVNIQYLFFSFWLPSLCITGSRFIHRHYSWLSHKNDRVKLFVFQRQCERKQDTAVLLRYVCCITTCKTVRCAKQEELNKAVTHVWEKN